MTEIMSGVENADDQTIPVGSDLLDEQLVTQLIDRAKAGGCS